MSEQAPEILLAAHLKSLKLPTVLREHQKLARLCALEGVDHVRYLARLVEMELIDRERRMVERRIKAARFPAYKDMAGFDFASSEVNEALVRQLHRGDFMDGAHNVVLIGGPGTGKTHIATAIGVQAVEHLRKKVRFFSTVELVNALEQEKGLGRSGQIAERLVRSDLVILDELGYLPFSA